MTGEDVAVSLRRGLRRQERLMIVIYVVLVLLGLYIYWDSRNARHALQREEARTTTALCTLRGDLKQRVESSEGFLAQHPAGIPGISAATIRTSITNAQRTVHALAGLKCGHP